VVQGVGPGFKLQYCKKKKKEARYWWLMSVILDAWKAEIGGAELRGQPRQIV
jgi:hypothetical protein